MKFDTILVEKYLNGTATAEEAEKVLYWFQTEPGRQYLEERFKKDAVEFGLAEVVSEPTQINNKITKFALVKSSPPRKLYRHKSILAVAASIAFLICLISVLQLYTNTFVSNEDQPATKVYQTTSNEHQIITLTDGTRIRLNENARILIDDFRDTNTRTVKLEGEAFFEVAHNPSKPFKVQSEKGLITVLGTAFNVKTSSPSRSLLIVAVSEGRVSLKENKQNSTLPEKILSKNEIGLFDSESLTITKESADINNYFTWMHGRVVYNKTSFRNVLKQLNHIYQIENEVTDTELYDLTLTADFSERSLNNVLETIAHSLDISAEIQGNNVTWSAN